MFAATLARAVRPDEALPHALDTPPIPDERWLDAGRITASLWMFVLLIYLPEIVARYRGDARGILVNAAAILCGGLLGAALFAAFRRARAWPRPAGLALLGAAALAATLIQTGVDRFATHRLVAYPGATRTDLMGIGRVFSPAYLCVFAANLAFFQLAAAARHGRRQDQRLTEMAAMAHRAEIDEVRHRLDPHFLFNALNGLSALVVTHRNAEAEDMIDRLAGVLRDALAEGGGNRVTLADEMALAERYARIEEARFADRLGARFWCASAARRAPVPALAVEPLVELALRDGLACASGPVRLRVHARRGGAGGGVGVDLVCRFRRAAEADVRDAERIAVLRRRLALLYDGQARLDASFGPRGFGAALRLPARMGEEA